MSIMSSQQKKFSYLPKNVNAKSTSDKRDDTSFISWLQKCHSKLDADTIFSNRASYEAEAERGGKGTCVRLDVPPLDAVSLSSTRANLLPSHTAALFRRVVVTKNREQIQIDAGDVVKIAKPTGRGKTIIFARIVFFVAAETLSPTDDKYGGVCAIRYKRAPEDVYGDQEEAEDARMAWLDFEAANGVKARSSDLALVQKQVPTYVKLKLVNEQGSEPIALGYAQETLEVERGITYHGLISQLLTKHKGEFTVHVPGTAKTGLVSSLTAPPNMRPSRADFTCPVRPLLVT